MELSEFAKKLEKMEMKYPGDASDALEKGAKKMLKALKKETPNSGKSIRINWQKAGTIK